MQHLEVSGAVRHIYIYIYVCMFVIRRLKVKEMRTGLRSDFTHTTGMPQLKITRSRAAVCFRQRLDLECLFVTVMGKQQCFL